MQCQRLAYNQLPTTGSPQNETACHAPRCLTSPATVGALLHKAVKGPVLQDRFNEISVKSGPSTVSYLAHDKWVPAGLAVHKATALRQASESHLARDRARSHRPPIAHKAVHLQKLEAGHALQQRLQRQHCQLARGKDDAGPVAHHGSCHLQGYGSRYRLRPSEGQTSCSVAV